MATCRSTTDRPLKSGPPATITCTLPAGHKGRHALVVNRVTITTWARR